MFKILLKKTYKAMLKERKELIKELNDQEDIALTYREKYESELKQREYLEYQIECMRGERWR